MIPWAQGFQGLLNSQVLSLQVPVIKDVVSPLPNLTKLLPLPNLSSYYSDVCSRHWINAENFHNLEYLTHAAPDL